MEFAPKRKVRIDLCWKGTQQVPADWSGMWRKGGALEGMTLTMQKESVFIPALRIVLAGAHKK